MSKPAAATASTLTISVTDSIALSVTAISPSGTFVASDTSTSNISVSTDNGTGYTLGIAASTADSNALINTEDDAKTIPAHGVSAGVPAANYADDTYASTNSLNNTWGYRPSKYYDTTNDITVDNTSTNLYFPGPTSTTATVLDITSSANASAANTYNIAIGARVNNAQASGSYENTFVFTVVANAIPYTITYNDSSSESADMPINESGNTYSETVSISSTEPTRSDYTFNGWCTDSVVDGAACTGITYAVSGNWTLDQTVSNNSLTLYAMWESAATHYTVTVDFDGGDISAADFLSYFTGVTVTNSTDATDVQYVTADGGTVSLEDGVSYTVEVTNPGTEGSASSPGVCYNDSSSTAATQTQQPTTAIAVLAVATKKADATLALGPPTAVSYYNYGALWSTTVNGTLGSSTGVSTTYQVGGAATLTIGADGWYYVGGSGAQGIVISCSEYSSGAN